MGKRTVCIVVINLIIFALYAKVCIEVPKADIKYSEALEKFKTAEYNLCEGILLETIKLYEINNDMYGTIQALILLEEVYYMLDEFKKLEYLFVKVEKNIKTINDSSNVLYLKHLLVKASYYRYTDNIEQATFLFKKIQDIFYHSEVSQELKSKIYRQLGNFYLFSTSDYYLAVKMFDSALVYLKNTDEYRIDRFKCHWCIGQALTRLKDYYHADNHLKNCEKMYEKSPELFKIHIAYVYSDKMEMFGALDNERMLNFYFDKISEHFNSYRDTVLLPTDREKYFLNYILSFINISDFYIKKKDHEKAVEVLIKAEKEANNTPYLLQFIYDRLSWIYLRMNKIKLAEYYANILLKLQLGNKEANKEALADTYFLLSELAREQKDYTNQSNYLTKILHLNYIPNPLKIKTLTNLGSLGVKNNQLNESFEYLNESIILNTGFLNPDSIYQYYSPDRVVENEYLFKALFEKGKIIERQAQKPNEQIDINLLNEAGKYFKYSIDLLEKYMPFLESDFDIDILLEEKRVNIKYYIQFLIDCYDHIKEFKYIETAFKYIEKSKAASLHLSFVENKAKITGNIPDYITKQELEINTNISKLTTQIKLASNKPAINSVILKELTDSITQLMHKKKQLISYLEESYPEYYNLKYNPYAITINDVKIKLKPNEALIEYYLLDDFLFSIYISDEYTKFNKQKVGKVFYELLQGLRSHIEKPNTDFSLDDNFFKFTNEARKTYEILIKPFDKYRYGKSLIIIPDNLLAMIPFDILLTSDKITSSGYDYTSLPYLIKETPLSYAYSASLFFTNESSKEFNNVIAFAPVKYPDKSIANDLRNIKGTEYEVRSIAKIFPTKIYLKGRATENNFKRLAKEHSILHIATHTVLDEKNSMFSKMVFHPEQSYLGEDGTLYAHEIYNMKFNAPMIVLSSCESGMGDLKPGEGFKSMAWGFKYAGVPSIVMTLWTVPDKVSADIIRDFYKYLKNGNSKDVAIQNSKVNYLLHCDPLKSHPYYWSSYNIIGDISPIYIQHSTSYKYIVFILSYVIVYIIYRIGIIVKKKQ